MAVRRVLALVLVLTVTALPAVLSSLHVHEYSGHDHPSHHHGPAAHHHERAANIGREHAEPEPGHDHDSVIVHAEDITATIESCDPGQHSITVGIGIIQVRSAHVDLAHIAGPTLFAPPVSVGATVLRTDVRVHGPPFDAQIPSRAPPVTHLA
jgi:hypothetical protein